MKKKMKPQGLAKLWREIKRSFVRRIKNVEKIKELKVCRNKINDFFGNDPGEISKIIDAALSYYRWRLFLGHSLLRLLHIHKPLPGNGRLEYFARHVGMDFEKEVQVTDEAWVFDGIKLSLPKNNADRAQLENEIVEILFPSYCKRKYESFDRYCAIFGNHLGDFGAGPYEYENVTLKEGDVVSDCGANLGVFSAMANRYGCQVFAFEAIPDIIDDYLSKTTKMNGNIRVCHFAVWDKEETLEFSLMLDGIGTSRCDQLLREQDIQAPRKQVCVPAITLDVFVERNNIDRVDFIKADIEGAERNMLRGAKKVLREFAPKLSICTYHLPDDPQVLRELILEANPKYQIIEKFSKMYAWVP